MSVWIETVPASMSTTAVCPDSIPYEDEARVSMLDSAIFKLAANSWLLGKISKNLLKNYKRDEGGES